MDPPEELTALTAGNQTSIANRLRSSVTIVVSPSIDAQAFAIRLNNMTDSKADIVTVVHLRKYIHFWMTIWVGASNRRVGYIASVGIIISLL